MSHARRIAILSALAILSVVSLSACGYNMGSSLDPRYQTIHVLPFKNDTGEYDLQAPLTNAITRKFLNDGRLRVVDRAAADLLVEGAILDYQLRGLTFDREDEVLQFEMIITAQTRVFDPDTGDILWSSRYVIGENSYSTPRIGSSSDRLRGNTQTFTPTVRSFQTDEENRAASEAIEGVASEIFIRTIEPW
ncbi:MAG: LptE family protein [Candidatus Hydrogenedentota bacterium]